MVISACPLTSGKPMQKASLRQWGLTRWINLHGVQGLVEGAVRAATPPMAASIRRVLAGLHSEKAAPGVDAMLLRVYEPIIFRHAGDLPIMPADLDMRMLLRMEVYNRPSIRCSAQLLTCSNLEERRVRLPSGCSTQ